MGHNQNPIHDQSANICSNPLYSQFSSDNPPLGAGNRQPFGASSGANISGMGWDPRVMLDNFTFLEEKIRQVKDVIRSMIDNEIQLSVQGLAQHQQHINAELTCLIVQLISTAGSLLPSFKNSSFSSDPPAAQLATLGSSSSSVANATIFQENKDIGCPDYDDLFKGLTDGAVEGLDDVLVDDHDAKDGDDGGVDGESLPPGSYEVLQLEKEEILAPHTHFCSICGKGFKRDANLRMHMRGHGDEYKSPAALAKPPRDISMEHTPAKRYSCPFVGCKRNKEHKNFQPLKTILCVKNHYKRSHCEKSYTCSRCHAKKFSVVADLKTHEKHCGKDKWLCSCGTTFSRKDKLFTHVALFQGHTPALPSEEPKISNHQEPAKLASTVSSFMWSDSGNDCVLDVKGLDNSSDFLSPVNFDSFGFGALHEFTGNPTEGSFSLLTSELFRRAQKNGEN